MYWLLSILIGFWMLQDFKRIHYSSGIRYIFLALCMAIQPFFLVYLFLVRDYRKAAGKPEIFTQRAVFILVLCFIVWQRIYSYYPVSRIIDQPYTKIRETDEAKVAEATEFLKNTGLNALGYGRNNEQTAQIALYLQQELDASATLLSRGKQDANIWDPFSYHMQEEHFGTPNTEDVWLFDIGQQDENTGRKIYAIVVCFQWNKECVLQEGGFTLQLGDGLLIYPRKQMGYLRLWAEGGKHSFFTDAAYYSVGAGHNSFHWYGKSLWKKYFYHGCTVIYVSGEEMPGDVTLVFYQADSGLSGRKERVYSKRYRFS